MSIHDFSIGFEVEYSFPSQVAAFNALGSRFGDVKYDGTVSAGFELASSIYSSKDFLANNDLSRWEELFGIFNALEVNTECNEGAGHHIHVNRGMFNNDQIYALASFVAGYGTFAKNIGGREFTTYCKNEVVPMYDIQTPYHNRDFPRYRAINPKPQHTLEFRFFKTTKSLHTFLKNMQFAIASSRFVIENKFDCINCKETDPSILSDFCAYIAERREELEHLHTFLTTRGLFPRSVKETTFEVKEYPNAVTAKEMTAFLNRAQQVVATFPCIPTQTLMSLVRSLLNRRVNIHAIAFIEKIVTEAQMKRALTIKFNV